MTAAVARARQRLTAIWQRIGALPRTPAGWRSAKAGHAAEQRGDWVAAVDHYRAALTRNGHMARIWISLGYAQLRTGDHAAAIASFRRAAGIEPGAAEPLRAIAHAAQASGDAHEAAAHHLAAYRRSGAFTDLSSFAAALPIGKGRDTLIGRAAELVEFFPSDAASPAGPTPTLLLDVTELLLWYRSFRLPSGVQRVQIGLVTALLSDPAADAAACRFDGGAWKVIGTRELLALLALSEVGDRLDDPAWQRALLATYLSVSRVAPLTFGAGTVLVSLGSWVTDEFLQAVDGAKAQGKLRYVPLIYDLIPILHPEWFPPGVADNFHRWLGRLTQSADAYVTISASTKRDLGHLAERGGRRVDPDLVTVMALDADCRSRFGASSMPETLGRYGLADRGYVLSVGTIEPRKNHPGALRAWQRLIASRGVDGVPTLLLVGHSGWKNEEVHRLLKDDAVLRSKVMILSGVADGDLSVLYTHARFILYPSFYEGWGLPVTEALCYGKAALVADNSSLPEAGGSFVDYFDAGDEVQMAERAERLIADDAYLAERERHVADTFRPRIWPDLAADVERAAATVRPAA